MTAPPPWPDEANKILREMWQAGQSIDQIADALATAGYVFTRNAIIGRRWRLHQKSPLARDRRPARKPYPQRSKQMSRPQTPKPEPAPEPSDGVDYMALTEDGCKAIRDDIGADGLHRCCGKFRVQFSEGRSSYCPTHHRLYNNVPTGH